MMFGLTAVLLPIGFLLLKDTFYSKRAKCCYNDPHVVVVINLKNNLAMRYFDAC